VAGAAGQVARPGTLRHHPLGADLARVLIEDGADDLEAIDQMQRTRRTSQQPPQKLPCDEEGRFASRNAH